MDNHNDNLARVILGVVDLNKDEQAFITALNNKYEALRNSLLSFALSTEHGSIVDR